MRLLHIGAQRATSVVWRSTQLERAVDGQQLNDNPTIASRSFAAVPSARRVNRITEQAVRLQAVDGPRAVHAVARPTHNWYLSLWSQLPTVQ